MFLRLTMSIPQSSILSSLFMKPIHLLRYLLVSYSLLLVMSSAATTPLLVKPLTYQGTMPYVESADAAGSRAATRINQAIYLDLLEMPAPARRQDGLKAKKRDGPMEPVSDIRFVVDQADARLLALSVTAEGCGAYCEGFTRSFVFDASSGRQVRATDLFTVAGGEALAALLARQRSTRIKAEVARLRAAANPATQSGKDKTKDERESSLEAAGMFEACLPQYTEVVRGPVALSLDEIRVKGSTVSFVRGRCSIHAMQALDELGEYINPVPLKDLTPHLNAYGKHLLGVGPIAPAPAAPFGQVLFGKVGTAPVTIWFRLPYGKDQELGGLYFYDRFRTAISFFGPRKGGAWELNEEAPEGKAAPVIRFTVNGDSIKGEWIGAGKRLPIEAGP